MKTILSISTLLLTAHLSSAQSASELAGQCRSQHYFTCNSLSEELQDDEITIRGCRNTCFYIDGIKVQTDAVPENVEDVSIITGGLPVNYGDLNSGVIKITKKQEENLPRTDQQ